MSVKYLRLLLSFILLLNCFTVSTVNAAQRIGSVARIKGQEPTIIQGFGLVTGLKGTGDKAEFKETFRSFGRMLTLTGHPNVTEKELGASKNIAFVYVTATIPAQGAREGSSIECTVSAVGNASSLKDGQLIVTNLIGPIPQLPEQTQVLAIAGGALSIEKAETPTVAKVTNGARLTANFRNPYIKDGCITLVLPEKHADWFMSTAIADAINQDPNVNTESADNQAKMALALDQQNILVKVPQYYLPNPAEFVALINRIELYGVEKIPTVVINERTGVIVIDQNVEIAPVTVSLKNITAQAGGAPIPGQGGQAGQQGQGNNSQRFVNIDLEEQITGQQNVKLTALRDSLNAMKVPPQDVIEIIKEIDAQGNLFGRIIYK